MAFKNYKEGQLFRNCSTHLSPRTAEILSKKSKEIGESIAKLIAIAVDNELEAPNPFYFSADLPTTEFIPHAYTELASKVYDYLKRFPSGVSPNHLLLNRRDAGIESKEEFLLALRELKELNMVEFIKVPAHSKHPYPIGYKFIKCITEESSKLTRAQRRKMEMAALAEQMKRLEGESDDE